MRSEVSRRRVHILFVILRERSLRLKDLLYFVCHPEEAFFATEGPALWFSLTVFSVRMAFADYRPLTPDYSVLFP
jgi:hypothetical protein